jgi:hypothetical protein
MVLMLFALTSLLAGGAANPSGERRDAENAGQTSATNTVSLQHPCGTVTGSPRADEVLLIWEENHSYRSVIGNPDASEFNFLATKCGMATDYHAIDHPSLPNYLEMTSGALFDGPPWTSDCDAVDSCVTNAASIFSELVQAKKQWRAYAESMTSSCQPASGGEYAARHNPAVYYLAVRRQCQAWDAPLGSARSGPLHSTLASGPDVSLITVTPNLDDDMHSGTVAEANAWLTTWMPQIVGSAAYRSGQLAVIIAWDEGFGSGDQASSAPMIVMSASTKPGTRSTTPYNDFSVLRSISEITGVPPLAHAATATSLMPAFRL